MNGFIALVGSGEYLETMEAVDRHLLAQLASPAKVVCYSPTDWRVRWLGSSLRSAQG